MVIVKHLLKPQTLWAKAIISVQDDRVTYSMTKLVEIQRATQRCSWADAYDFVEHNLLAEQRVLKIIIIDDTQEEDIADTLDDDLREMIDE